jgi:hypothetical protein
LYRDAAPSGFDHTYLDRFKTCLPESLYRDRAFLAPICTLMAKTRAVVRSLQA